MPSVAREYGQRASRVVAYGPDIGSNGCYRLAAASGLLTAVAAATATAGHLFAFRWTSATVLALVENVRARWLTVAGFTGAQEVGLDVVLARAYTAAHAGGTALTLTGNNGKLRSSYATTALGGARIADTGELTAGTHTLDAQALALEGFSELATAAAVPKGSFDARFVSMPGRAPLVLAQNEGFIVRNRILMGAGGTARLFVEMDWREVDTYAQ